MAIPSRLAAAPPIPGAVKKEQKPQLQQKVNFTPDEMPKMADPRDRIFTFNVSGEPNSGKTHLLRTFRRPLFLDTEGKAWVVLEKFPACPWKRVRDFNDVREGIHWALQNPDIDTIVIDSSADLADLGADEYLDEHPDKKAVFPIASEYKKVYKKIDELVMEIQETGKYLAVSSRRKDEYLDDKRTGRRVLDSYKKFPWDLMISIELVNGIRDPLSGRILYPEYRFGRVEKNNFFHPAPDASKTYMKPYIFDVTFEGIRNEMLMPWHGEEGVKISEIHKTIVNDAKLWIDLHQQ